MKKLIALLLAICLIGSLAACAPSDADTEGGYKVAMITDYGDITDQSFNQTTWEAVQAFGAANNIPVKYYKPTTNDNAGRIASVEGAIADGYNVIVMPGYAFGATIYEVQDDYPDVKFIALDVAEFDIYDCFYNHDEAGNQTGLIDENNQPHLSKNVYCAIYQEEISGYMAGYAAVKLGYEKLGFLGGMAVPAVIRFGYGYVQGANDAAKEMDKTVSIKYAYGNQFFGDPDITGVMDTWYGSGTQVVFACGGGIYTSAAEAAKKVGGKVIGVDVDQAATIDGIYGEGMTITSAMKGLYPTTVDTLTDVIINGKWETYSGKIVTLGMVSGTDASANYVQLGKTQFAEGKFTEADYTALAAAIFNGTVTISGDTTTEPTTTNATVEYLGNLK